MNKQLFLLDGMALVYRAHFAFIRRPIYNSKGFNTSAIYGFANTMVDLIQNQQPTHIAAVFDTEVPTERHRIYPQYKANRQEMPEDLSQAIPHVYSLVEAFNIPVITLDGYEADDIIGTLALKAEAEDFETFMVTPDKDYGQLVSKHTFMYRPSYQGDGAEIYGVNEILQRWGIERVEQVIDALALCGDSSDNIPGVPKIGPKTAQKLIATYGSVENLLAHTDQLKGKQKENLETFADQALLSKKLATIDRAVPLDTSLDALVLNDPDPVKMHSLFIQFEFRTLGKRIFGKDYTLDDAAGLIARAAGEEGLPEAVRLKTIEDVGHHYELVSSAGQRTALIEQLKAQPAFCFDTETTGLDPRKAELIGIAFSFAPQSGFFVHLKGERDLVSRLLDEFASVFADPAIEKVGHNLKFDLAILKEYGVEVSGPLFDTMIAHALVEPELRHGMDYLAETYFKYSPISITSLIGEKGEEQKSMAEVEIDLLKEYAVEDADITWQLRDILKPQLEEKNQHQVFYDVESPLIRVLADMEHTGIRLDSGALREFSVQLTHKVVENRERIMEIVGHPFHLDSPKQLGIVLFEELKLSEKPKKTRTGQYATNEQVLNSLAARHEIVRHILNYRMAVKLKSTYVDTLPGTVFPPTGRVHTHYSQLHAATGRLQSNGPNLQNIPIRTELGQEIRKAFVARDDEHELLSADYSQIELRIIAGLSKDEGLLEAFARKLDIHTATAARVYHISESEVIREMRSKAKMVNYGIPYGISAFGLSQRLNIARREAAELINEYFNQFPGIRRYIDSTLEFARENGYVETLTGRRRRLRDIKSANAPTRNSAERNAINTPIQGSAADLIKIAMARIYGELESRRLKTKLLLQVHDELLFDLYKPERDEVVPIVEEGMKNALDIGAPIEVDMGWGRNWLDAH